MALRRVLFAVAAAVPSVGYCQGINFIAGKCMHFSACPPPSPPLPPPPISLQASFSSRHPSTNAAPTLSCATSSPAPCSTITSPP